jgi:TolA protein
MKFGQAKGRASPAGHPDRRLIGGLLVSLLLHGLLLLLQFGVPGMGMPGSPPPLTVRIAAVSPPPLPLPPVPDPLPESPVPTPLAPPHPVTGMQMVDPVAAPLPPPPVKAAPAVKKGKPRRARRISTPLPARETLFEPPRVISQDSTVNDFVVPLARPEEAEQKTVDLKEAQHGEDDGDAATSAALEAAEAQAGKLKAEQEAAKKLADETRAAEQEQQRLAALAQQKKADEQAETARLKQQELAEQKLEQQKVEQATLEQKKEEQLQAERRRAEQLKLEQEKAKQAQLAQQQIDQQKAEQQKAEQQKAEQQKAEQQKIERKLAEQKAEQQRAEQQKVEQQRAEQQKAEQKMAVQQKVEQQRAEQQKAEKERAEQQRAEQQRAEQQKAEQQRANQQRADREAADQRGRDLAAARQPGIAGQGGPAGGSGGGGSGVQIPRNMLGSDLGNRARDLVKGLDVLRGAPPVGRREGDRRAVVSFNERDLPLKMYVESWRQKIERNGALNYPRSWADEVRIDPLVSVAVRSDGSIEDVVIVSSSGRADMDDAVRRIVRVNARYSAFPPQIAAKYDVIEIRRVWRFDDALKLMEELH